MPDNNITGADSRVSASLSPHPVIGMKLHEILLRVHLASTPGQVFNLFATDSGRTSFWASSSQEDGNEIKFIFPNGEVLMSRVLESLPPWRFSFTYFNATTVVVELQETNGGTDLLLRESSVRAEDLVENRAGWISVLLNLKAQADHGVDLRNHDRTRTWDDGYVDN